MRKDRDNPLALLSKKPCQSQTDYGGELERLRADLEAEKNQTQRAQRQLCVELRHLREEAKREQRRAVRELTARRGAQKDRHSNRRWHLLAKEVIITDAGRYSKVRSTGKESFCLCSGETSTKLEQLLLTLYEEINGEQAVYKLHHRQEFEVEKAIVLCHLLEAHRRLLQGRQRAGHPSYVFKNLSRKPAREDSNKSCQTLQRSQSATHSSKKITKQDQQKQPLGRDLCAADPCTTAAVVDTCRSSSLKICHPHNTPHAGWYNQPPCCTESSGSDESSPPKCMDRNMENGSEYVFLVRQNSELLRALDELEKTCTILREENGLLRKSSAPETEEKVRRLRRKNTELAVLAKRLEERARKLQEANLKVVNSPSLMRPGSVEQYKRAFARQRARDLAQHADALLSKDKEIAALQQECRELEARLGTTKGSPVPSGRVEFEKLLRESQREVLRLQRQLSVTSSTQQHNHSPDPSGPEKGGETEKEEGMEKVVGETPCVALDEAPSRCEKTPGEEEESGLRVTPPPGLSPTPSHQEEHTDEQRLQFLESELSKKRKECENLEHEVKKRQKRCLYLESQLEDERGKNEQLKEEADLLRRKAQLLDQTRAENEELREDLSEVTAQHNSVLEENQRLRAKLENLEQVLKHMREVAERRQQLELEHEQALAILKFKQDEIKRLQRAQLFAKREHEGVVQMLEDLTQLVLRRELSKVRELEEKCRSQSEQFGLLSQELEKFRLQASKVDLAGSSLLNNPSLSVLTNGVGLTTERDCTGGSWDMVSLGEIAFWSLEAGDTLSCPEGNDPPDVAAALRMGSTPHAAGLSRVERSPVTKHRELPTISVSKSGSSSSKSETTHLTPKSDTHLSPHKSSPIHEVDTASEVEELDIDMAPAPYTASRVAAKLQVFIARYSYNPYDGPNDNPEVELPLTAGEYIYVYGDMDDDGFYEGELMDGRRGLVPSNFVERVSDDDVMSTHHPETGDISHNSLLDSSLHSASHQHHLHMGVSASERTEASAASGPASAPLDSASALAVPAPLTNGLDLDLEEVGVDTVPYPRKLTLIKQLAKSIIIGWDPPLVPAGWGNVWSYNVYVDQEMRFNVPFGAQTKAVLERLDINLKAYRVSVQSLTEKGLSDQLRCSMLVGRDVCVAPTQLRVDRITATSANLTWLPSNSNYVHIVSLNEEECELVKAGCYSLCLNNLLPSLQYTVKVEARPHRTPWELPVERREHRSTIITFTTLMAGPPDAPLDVQLEHGPSPGIALISWLPVTIDAAGTSNGVRVTGYTIYADKKKVLEVSSPTAGSALLGPSQIQSLQAAQELTVRTMSAHVESCDSLPVNVPSKLAAIMAGPAITAPVVPPPLPCTPTDPTNLPSPPSYMNSAAKFSMLPSTLPSDTHSTGLTVEAAANPHPLPSEDFLSSASYVKAWANPSSADALAVCEATLPVAPTVTPVVNVTSPTTTAPQPSPVAAPAPAQAPLMAAAAVLEQRRDTNSPGTIRPFPSITEFIEDPSAKLGTPERIPTPPKAPITDLLNPQDTNLHRPPSTSPLESEVEEEQENTRLVSIEEFLRQDQEPAYCRRQQSCGRGLVEPPNDYHVDNSRSDLSDILEEEEEDLYSDHIGEAQARGYTVGANREPTRIPPSEASPSWGPQPDLSSKPVCLQARELKGGVDSIKMKDSDIRIFVALFPYYPATMSPNPDAAEEELPFSEGQIIKVYGDKDADGFYQGESGGRLGYVPCNMVSEIQVEDEETRQQLLQQGFLSTAASMEKIGTRTHAQLPRRPVPPPKPRRSKKVESAALWEESIDSSSQDPSQTAAAASAGNPAPGARRMVAIFDYDPRESSPNTDIEAELTFSAGDIIHVFGDMDEDGFFYGDLNGHRGLVPSNFLQALPADAPAELLSAQPAPEPKKELQVALHFCLLSCTLYTYFGHVPKSLTSKRNFFYFIFHHLHVFPDRTFCHFLFCFFNPVLSHFFCPTVSCMALCRNRNELFTLRLDRYRDVFYRATGSWTLNNGRIFACPNRAFFPRPKGAHRPTTRTGTHCEPHVRPGVCSRSSCYSSCGGGLLLPPSPPSSRHPNTDRLLCTSQEEERLFLQRQEAVQKAGIQQERMRVRTPDSGYSRHIESTFSIFTVSLSR
ncbi:peripheral-type benzodiazepine receptor-associated protein 1-like [Xiphias gladius]|uniref:peripheral-type benzodiazepine receptor-associated protein 1-like n=1 Tax=Xiphias gladius TaxID=8245 RepID=UPI001A99B558|nr:peripheral-type benzodiazepine receptor-associated protein 1-like [Xiphias gladius]